MKISLTAEPLLSLAIDVTSEHRVDAVLRTIVKGLAAQPGVALARIWLVFPPGWCALCDARTKSPDQAPDLHLVASAGNPVNSPGEDWSFLQGHFHRIALNAQKVGQVAGSKSPIHIEDFAPRNDWISRPEWAEREYIRSFAGHPLVFRGELLGTFAAQRPGGERVFVAGTFCEPGCGCDRQCPRLRGSGKPAAAAGRRKRVSAGESAAGF